MALDRVPQFLLNWEIRNARKKTDRNHKRNEKRKTFYLKLLNSVVRTNNNINNKIVPLNYDDTNDNGNDKNDYINDDDDINLFRVSIDSIEKLKADAKAILEVPSMSVDLQAAQLAKELQLGRNEIINLCNRSFDLYKRLDSIRDLSSKLNSRLGGVGCYGGHIARLLKSPGPHNGHRKIKDQDRLVTETSFQCNMNVKKRRPTTRESPNRLSQPCWNHTFNKAMLLTPLKFIKERNNDNSDTAEVIFTPLLKSSKSAPTNSKSSFITNDRPTTPTTNTNTNSNFNDMSTPHINTNITNYDLDHIINSPLKKSNSEIWFKLKKLWVSVSIELKHAGDDISYDDLLEISTMKECSPHIMHLLGYFLALLGKEPDWSGICTTLFRNLQWWLQLIQSIDTSVCSISRCEKAHQLKMMDPEMYPPICRMKISIPIFKIIRWVNAFDFLILIIMEIDNDISNNMKPSSKKNKSSKTRRSSNRSRKNSTSTKETAQNNILTYFGIGPNDHLEMLSIFLEAEEDEMMTQKNHNYDNNNDDDDDNDNNNNYGTGNNINNNNRKNVSFDVEQKKKDDYGNSNNDNDDDNVNDDYYDDDEDFNDNDNNDNDNDNNGDNNNKANDITANISNQSDDKIICPDAKVGDDIGRTIMVMDMLDATATDDKAEDGSSVAIKIDEKATDLLDSLGLDDTVTAEAKSDHETENKSASKKDNDEENALYDLLDSLGLDDTVTAEVETDLVPENKSNKDKVAAPKCIYCNVAKTSLHTFLHHPYIQVLYDNSTVYTCNNCVDSFWSFRIEVGVTLEEKFIADDEVNEQICAMCSDCPDSDLVLCKHCPRSFCQDCLTKLKNMDTNVIFYNIDDKSDWKCMCCYNNQSSNPPIKNDNIDDNEYDDEFDF